MNILGITPHNEHTKLTPEEKYLLGLRSAGHNVTIISSLKDYAGERADVVVAMSEVSCEDGYNLSQYLNVPFYAHMEWLPVWRLFFEDEKEWGFENSPISYAEKVKFINLYSRYSYFWNKADVKSLAGECFKNNMFYFLGFKTDIETKYLGVNFHELKEEAEKFKNVKKENEIVCVSRFVPHKRIHHIIEAMKLLNDPTLVLNLVGYGNEQKHYDSIKGDLKIVYWNSCDKYEAMARSKLCVSLWSGLVPAEAAFFGCPTISYMSDYMFELFDRSIFYAKNNDVNELSLLIEFLLGKTSEERELIAYALRTDIECKEINTFTVKEALALLESFIIKAINKRNGVKSV